MATKNLVSRVNLLRGGVAMALALLAAGCGSHHGYLGREPFTRIFTPHPPIFLTGPAAVLLTNATGYSAQLTAQASPTPEAEGNVSGQLLCRGSKLLFAPEPAAVPEKGARQAGFSFIWDVAANNGYVLSEALQGYAPASAAVRATNWVSGTGKGTAEKIAGHVCDPTDAAVQMSDGSTMNFQVLRAVDLAGFPLRVTTLSGSAPLTLNLAKVRSEAPPAELFALPDGFTKYSSAEALVDELAARKLNLRRRSRGESAPFPEHRERY